jgi:hypothetical protein
MEPHGKKFLWALKGGEQFNSEELLIIIIIIIIIIIFSGSAAQRGLWPPLSRGFLNTHNDAPQSV